MIYELTVMLYSYTGESDQSEQTGQVWNSLLKVLFLQDYTTEKGTRCCIHLHTDKQDYPSVYKHVTESLSRYLWGW